MKSYKRLWFALILLSFCCSNIATAADNEANREKLLFLLSGEWISRALYVATKLEIADHLQTESKSIEELASVTHSDPESLQRLLHMLAGFGIFEENSPGVFSNTDTSHLLAKSNPHSLHALSTFYGEDIHNALDELLPCVQTGSTAFQLKFKQPVFQYFKENSARAALFQNAMKEKSQAVINSVLSTYDFSTVNTVYDVGGGYGIFMQALLTSHPHLHGVVFELPEVIEAIKQRNPSVESHHCQLVPGDFFVSIPKNGDIYFLKSILHDWDDRKCERILQNCHQAMDSNSRLLIVEVMLQPKDESLYANSMDVLMMAITGGKERTLASFKSMLENSDFVLEHVYPTSTEFSILEARKK